MDTLRAGISDVVNTLNKLMGNSTDPDEQEQIQKVLRVLFMLWEEVIRQEIDSSTAKYKAALDALSKAEKTAQDAIKDINKVADAIETAVKAAKAVDKIVKVVADVFA